MISKSCLFPLASCLLGLALIFPLSVFSQTPVATPSAPEDMRWGGYRVHQSFEAGYRVSNVTGSETMFDTLVNEHQGPRLFEQTLSLQSVDHLGLFDDFFVNSSGWGGEPNNFLRLRANKSRWYDFRASFRRDQNFFGYDLLANPLNPSSSVPAVQVETSPHQFETRRRMSDFDLTLLPQHRLSFRLGYSHNNMTGPSWTSIHQGTDALLAQPWNTTLNAYRFGVDLKPFARTVLSYDQFLNYAKNDNSAQLNSTPFALAGGIPVDLGLPFNTGANQPCAAPLLSDGTANPACNGYFSYQSLSATRTTLPTEQLSLRSQYFQRVELTGSVRYNSGDLKLPAYSEVFDGLITRNRTRNSVEAATVRNKRVDAGADFGTVVHLTPHLRLVETFRFNSFRLPTAFNYTIGALFGTTLLSTPNVFSPATCPPPFTAATCPQHNSSSGADITIGQTANFLKQDTKTNTLELQYDFSRQFTGHIGYRYQRRSIFHSDNDAQLLMFEPSLPNRGVCAGIQLDPNGVCTTTATTSGQDTFEIHGNSWLAGMSVRPNHDLRINFDTEQFYADHSFTRLTFTRESKYRLGGSFAPRHWAVISASLNTVNDLNDDPAVNYRGHNYNGGFNLSLNPRERFGVDLAYNYNSYLQNSIICFNDTPPTGVILPVVANAGDCSANDAGNPLLTDGTYQSTTHYGMSSVMFKPSKRVTTRLGYGITSVGGSTPQFNILQPQGPLAYNFQQPLAGLDINLARDFVWHAGWNYDQYGEKDVVGPTLPRYFHANHVTLSLKYAF